MSEQTETTFAIPVVWEVKGVYKVKAKNPREAISKVVLTPELPQEKKEDMDTFQINMPKIPKLNDIVSDDQINKMSDEIEQYGWKGFAMRNREE